jgi:hypothetical protein
MDLAEDLLSLVSLASRTVLAAAATDGWEMAKRGIARLLGRGDPHRTEVAERRLEQTRQQLAGASGAERAQLAISWQMRLSDLLEEQPDAAADLRMLIQQLQALLPAGVVSAVSHGVVAGRDVRVTASGGGVAVGTIHGNITPPNPTIPGPAEMRPGSGRSGFLHRAQ